MKSFIARFVADQSGAVDFEDGLTAFAMICGFIVALALMNFTIIQLWGAIAGLLPG
jgi:Flp pilus assembly pilin Flp